MSGGNGVYAYGASSGFPANSFNAGTLVANLLADRIRSLDETAIDRLLDVLNR